MTGDAKRVSDAFPQLFHYTTAPAFENIYASRTFWATHYQDLNDSSELLRFRLKVRAHIAPHIRKIVDNRMQDDTEFANGVDSQGGIDAVVDQQVSTQLDLLHRSIFCESRLQGTFVCSFCAHDAQSYEAEHGLLSQWRGYGTGGGVAIVLDTKGIEDRMKHESDVFAHPINHIGDVKYDEDDVGIQTDFCAVFQHLPGILDALYSGQEPGYSKMFDHFVQGSTLVKHHGFREESEIRIVVSPRPSDVDSIFNDRAHDSRPRKVIRYRRKGDGEVRFLELFGEAPLPIKRVIVGPSRVQNLNQQQITALVAGSDIVVVKSETPYLG